MKTFTKIVLVAFLLATCITKVSFGQITLLDPSSNPPNGLQPKEVPQFVIVGFDDNERPTSMQWAIDMFTPRVNPAGSGQAATYDGKPARASYYNTSVYVSTGAVANPDLLKLTWNAAYLDGNEIGEHTHTHGTALVTANEATWNSEISTCIGYLTAPTPPISSYWTDTPGTGAGVPKSNIVGHRTPFLAYGGPVFPACKANGLWYDCSIEEGNQLDQDGTNFYWPYTFDHSSLSGHYASWLGNPSNPDSFTIPDVPGFWELPNCVVIVPDDATATTKGYPTGMRAKIKALPGLSWFEDKMTGFDYNLWAQCKLTRAEVTAILKHNLDLRYTGNRSPYMFGAHTGEYAAEYNSNCAGAPSELDRRGAWEDFITYALLKPDVRVVTGKQVIEWMKNPVALAVGNGPFTLEKIATNGSISTSPSATQYNKGTVVTITAVPNSGYEFVSWSGDASGSNATTTVTMNNNVSVTATFKLTVAGCSNGVNLMIDGDWSGFSDASSTVDTVFTVTGGVLTAPYTVAKMSAPNAYDTYVSVSSYSGLTDLVGLCSVKITYKSDNALILSLPQPGLDEQGTSYMVNLTASSTWKTLDIPVANFMQPDWIDPITQKADLDLSKITGIALTPDVDVSAAAKSGTIQVNQAILYGVGTSPVSINETTKTNLSIYYNNSMLNINASTNGKYLVNMYSIDGSLVYSKETNLTNGQNAINLNSTIAEGTYIVKLISSNKTEVKQIAVIK